MRWWWWWGASDADGENPAPTGLIPVAAAPGTMLYTDASVLRPLRAGAVWTYRGVQVYSGQARVPVEYSNAVRHVAAAADRVSEEGTNPFNGGPDSVTLALSGGAMHSLAAFETLPGRFETIDEIELRSPVRVNDQYTVMDRVFEDSGLDLDDDGRRDALGIAVYKMVIGQEAVALPHVPTIDAVRVRTYMVARYRLTSNGTYTDTVTATMDAWYAPGVGVVKLELDEPYDSLGFRMKSTETLVNWNGITEGIGALDSKPVFNAQGERLGRVVDAVSFKDHALVASQVRLESLPADGIALTALDGFGNVLSSQTYPSPWAMDLALVAMNGQANLIAPQGPTPALKMFSFDSSGAPTGASPVTLTTTQLANTTTGERVVAATSGSVLWVSWIA